MKVFKDFDSQAFGMAIKSLPENKKMLAVRMVVRDLSPSQRTRLFQRLKQIRRHSK
ncbi:hypothetical protein [Selenomonas ruminantium]|uniref:hypothetical protein n=1 Tax=Selenomonas ruminantium TaxID=971 RepID=UPI0026E985E9|nr:hypothetical protein [Selenomonas ruminantium]